MFCIFVLMGLALCRTAGNPFTPSGLGPRMQGAANPQPVSGRQLWGFWNAYIPLSNDTIEFVPIRNAEFHLNARRFLEDTVCKNCLKLLSVDKDYAGMVMTAQVQFTHPFPGLPAILPLMSGGL